MRRSTDKNPETVATDAMRWPSFSFLWGGVKRQFLFATMLTVPVFFLVLFALSQLPWKYTSNIAVIFDTTESTGTGENTLVAANRVTNAYVSRFNDPGFFERIVQRLAAGKEVEPSGGGSSIREYLKNILPENLHPASWKLPARQQELVARAEELKNSLEPTVVPGQFILNLAASAKSPDEAKNLAEAAMAQFVVDELQQRHMQTMAKVRELRALEADVLKEKQAPSDVNWKASKASKDSISDAKGRSTKAREQELVRETLLKKADFDRAQTTQETRLLLLNDELNNLLSRKGVTHPDVIQKQREIDKLKAEPVAAPIQAELNRLQTQLANLQRDMKASGLPIDRSVQVANFPDDIRRILTDLATQIRTMENLASELLQDMKDPLGGRRFTAVRGPELPASPSNKKQFLLAIPVGLMLCLLTFGMTILIREINQPGIVASEQVDRIYGVFPTAEVKPSWLRSHPIFEIGQIRELRPQLGQLVSSRRPELMLLDAYRHIAQLVDQMQNHQITVVFDTATGNHADNLAANLTKVLTVDSGRRALFLSFRGRDSRGEENTADLMQFLAGKAEWKDVRLKGSADGSHDTAYARDPLGSLGVFQEDLVQRLFKSLREKYQVIVIEAFPPAFHSENGVLHSLADAVVLQIRLGETRHEDLQRLLHFMDHERIAATLIS